MKNLLTFERFINESVDVKYWADYNDTFGRGNKKFAGKSNKFNKNFFNKAMISWNEEAYDSENMLRPFTEEYSKVYKIAKEFFKKAGWISVNVIHAMIAQES